MRNLFLCLGNPFKPSTKPLRLLCTFVSPMIVLTLFSPSTYAKAEQWTVEPQESSIRFSLQHLTFSRVEGRFTKFSGTLDYDGVNLTNASVSAIIASDSIDTKNNMRDNHLRNDDVLDVRAYPSIKFVSRKINPHADGSFDVVGDLELHGVIKPVTLVASPIAAVRVDSAGKKHMLARAATVIDRKSFGVYVDKSIDKGGHIVGDQVKVELKISLVEKLG
ncbi:MAG: YceI family protein [Candidatus Obscuribacterales bacterium]|nr:YceI family protein [Candidatus Obscuribacterales bacterium]